MDARISHLRIVACAMVVLLHVCGTNVHEFSERWWSANVYNSLTRACVPLFFMISGATLLHKDEPLGAFLRKRLVRIVPPLLLWSLVYLGWLYYCGVHTGNWIVAILSGPTMYHLWYFYAVLGLYAFVPVLRRFVQNCTSGELGWFLGIWFAAASAFPMVYSLVRDPGCGYLRMGVLEETYHLTNFGGYAGFFVLGAVLRDHAARLGGWRTGLPVFLAASVATGLAAYLQSASLGAVCEFFYLYLSPLVVLAACGLFIAVAGFPNSAPSSFLQRAADSTLGIYGLHILVIDRVAAFWGLSARFGNPWLTTPFTAAVVLAVCFVVIDSLRRIAPLRSIF
ncbi:acyltransferase [Paraburkholderia hospita]|uniref:acyltransferase n=1 Tax=Paraburkholderia hospita TaxID=169430 RepID=UPI00055974F2|nr:acyltransferase family protein [Paraburkholderia hospita]SKC94041.1 Surface polysaccharide O-acyltransferase, integral membrane enzyme [Paraburkholderia hospita]